MTLFKSIRGIYSQKTEEAVQAAFNDLHLPEPQQNEFYVTNDKSYEGFLVFLTPYGCALRLTWQQYPLITAPHVMKPLHTIDAGLLRLDINPGLPSPVRKEDLPRLQQELHQDLCYYSPGDLHIRNASYLPRVFPADTTQAAAENVAENNAMPEDYIIAIDLPGLHRFTYARNPDITYEVIAQRHNWQDVLFGRLQAAFTAAAAPQPGTTIDTVWEECQKARTSGLLTSSWENLSEACAWDKNIVQTSRAYTKRLMSCLPV